MLKDDFQDDMGLDDFDDLFDGLPEAPVTSPVAHNLNMQADNVQDLFGLKTKSAHAGHFINSIEFDDIDREGYQYMIDMSPHLENVLENGLAVSNMFGELMEDLYMSLFKYSPQLRDMADISKSVHINRLILDSIIESQDYKQLRILTRLDELKSAIGLNVLATSALEIVKKVDAELKKLQTKTNKPAKDALDELYAIDEMMKKLTNDELAEILKNANDGQQSNGAGQDAAQQALGQLQQISANNTTGITQNTGTVSGDTAGFNAVQAQQIADALANDLDDIMDDIDDLTADTAAAAGIDGDDLSDTINDIHLNSELIDNWGMGAGSDGDNGTRVPVAAKVRALNKIRNSSQLKKLSDLIGKLKKIARFEQKQKTNEGSQSIKSVEIGNDMESVLPSEKLLLSNPRTKMLFYQKFSEKQLLQYKKDCKKRKGKGPIIICGDESGSMSGQNDTYAKAVALTFLEIAQRQKRDFAYIPFSDKVGQAVIIEKGKFDPNDAINLATRFRNGGTDFEEPLEKALSILEDSRFHKADIIIVTDGDAGISSHFIERFNKAKKEKEFKLQGIVVDAGHNSRTSLDQIADNIMNLSSIDALTSGDADLAHELFKSV